MRRAVQRFDKLQNETAAQPAAQARLLLQHLQQGALFERVGTGEYLVLRKRIQHEDNEAERHDDHVGAIGGNAQRLHNEPDSKAEKINSKNRSNQILV